MVIKNKATNKEYPISTEKWNAFKPEHKALFIVVDNAELKNPEKQPITNKVVHEPKTGKPDKKGEAPKTGDKKK
jgi:hypothetical protein